MAPNKGEPQPLVTRVGGFSPIVDQRQSIVSAYAAAMPKFDFSSSLPALGSASLVSKIDTNVLASIANVQNMVPKLGPMHISVLNMDAALPKIEVDLIGPKSPLADIARVQGSMLASLPNYSKLLGSMKTGWIASIQPKIELTASLQPVLDVLRSIHAGSITWHRQIPDNWPDNIHERFLELVELVNNDGIPATWVPRSEVLDLLLSAATGDERSEVLTHHREEILDDCAGWLDDLVDPVLDPLLPTAQEVVDACRSGLWRVGAISAVQVVHSVVESLQWVCDRQRVAKHHQLKLMTPYTRLSEQATRAPLVLFYDDWNPLSGKPRPAHLTRHVISHRLGEDQVNERNCIVAVMLMVSLLVTVYQLGLGHREAAA